MDKNTVGMKSSHCPHFQALKSTLHLKLQPQHGSSALATTILILNEDHLGNDWGMEENKYIFCFKHLVLEKMREILSPAVLWNLHYINIFTTYNAPNSNTLLTFNPPSLPFHTLKILQSEYFLRKWELAEFHQRLKIHNKMKKSNGTTKQFPNVPQY